MNKIDIFSEDEMPYEVLSKYGMTREMIEDLPGMVKNRMLSGRETPSLPFTTVQANNIKTVFARVMLFHRENGDVGVYFIPVWERGDLSAYSADTQKELMMGKVVKQYIPDTGECYLQFDKDTNRVMSFPCRILDANISSLVSNLGWGETLEQTLKNCDVVTIKDEWDNDNDNSYSVGIDLNTDVGIRISSGDVINWKREMVEESLPKYNFGLFGCWVNDDIEGMRYVKEEDYTDEMWNQMERSGDQNAAKAQMRSLGLH